MSQKHEVTKCFWRNQANRFAQCKVATTLQLKKKKNQYLWNAVKQSAVKQGMPVYAI